MNEALFNTLIESYNSIAYTHDYIFGFVDHRMIYVSITDKKLLPYICKLDKASRGQGYSLRFSPNRNQKELLKTQKCFILCSSKEFKQRVKESIYNKGETFEKMIAEHYGQDWVKDNIPFTDAGDIKVGETSYQVKFARATFCNENSIRNLLKKKGSDLTSS